MPTSNANPPDAHDAHPGGVAKDIDWQDYRDHLATADKEGRRQWVYAKKPAGKWHRRRAWFAALLILIMFAGPWIRINGNPLLLVNIIERRFSILGQIFWPQDTVIFAVAMLTFFVGIIIFTAAFGRLWCGWACPQTVMMEMVFRKLEYLIEGDAHEQKALAAAPWGAKKIFKKLLKHAVFFGASFIVGNTLLAYIIGSDQLLAIQLDDPRNHLAGLTFMVLFTLLFYGIFARFREQACTFICPYGRFQSTMLDENTMVVSYDFKRGEKRAPWRRDDTAEKRAAAGQGDCIGCRQCVVVCPTGIDIRNGLQMECVNCTACIDACDSVMDKIERPRGLIRYASSDNILRGLPQRYTARMKLYTVVITALISLFLFLVFTRSEVETALLRAPGSMFQQTAEGRISNLYNLRIVNKTSLNLPIELKLENTPGILRVMGGDTIVVAAEKLATSAVLIELDRNQLKGANTPLVVGVYSRGKRIETVKTTLVGPRN
jgi:cytochrome c oxidase accessory protein FixG